MVARTHRNVTLYVHCLSCLCFAVEISTFNYSPMIYGLKVYMQIFAEMIATHLMWSVQQVNVFRTFSVRFNDWSGLHQAWVNLTDLCEALTEWNADETRRGGLLESRSVHHKFHSHRGLKQRFRGKKTAMIIANYDGQCYRCFKKIRTPIHPAHCTVPCPRRQSVTFKHCVHTRLFSAS